MYKYSNKNNKCDLETNIHSEEKIFLYNKEGNFKNLSNFYIHKKHLLYKGKSFKSAEHLFYYLKFNHKYSNDKTREYAEIIRTSKTPYMAKILGNMIIMTDYPWQIKLNEIIEEYKKFLNPKINFNPLKTMKKVLNIKFDQDLNCKNTLESTKGKIIIDNNGFDIFWGNGIYGEGDNNLGKLLMEKRSCI